MSFDKKTKDELIALAKRQNKVIIICQREETRLTKLLFKANVLWFLGYMLGTTLAIILGIFMGRVGA